jgi:hypothetical protein
VTAKCDVWRTLWASSRTAGVLRLGVQQVTVPLAWPSCSTAFQGFCAMTPHGPSRVLCCATSCPVLVSCSAECRALGCKSPKKADLAASRYKTCVSHQNTALRQKRVGIQHAHRRVHLICQHAGLPNGCQ